MNIWQKIFSRIICEILNHIGLTVFCLEQWSHKEEGSLTTEDRACL